MTVLFLIMTAFASAQEFIDIDYHSMSQDTILPVWSTSRMVSGSCYEAEIEYPEFEPVSDEDQMQWHLERYKDCIPDWPEIKTYLGTSVGQGILDISFVPVVQKGGGFYKITSFKLNIKEIPLSRVAVRASNASDRYAAHSVLSEGKWAKLSIPSTGVYRISRKSLEKLGFKDISKVRLYGYGGNVLPETGLAGLTDDLKEIPALHDADGLLFYGKGPDGWKISYNGVYERTVNTYSTFGSYFVTASDSIEPMAIENVEAVQSSKTVTDFPEHYLYETDAYSWYHSGRQFFDSYDYLNGASQTYKLPLDGIVTEDSVRLTVAFSTNSGTVSSVLISADGTEIGTLTIPAVSGTAAASVGSKSFICNGIFAEDSKLKLTHNRTSGTSGRLDYISINYTRRLSLEAPYTCFRTGNYKGNASFSIDAAGASAPQVWQVDADGVARLVQSETNGGTCMTQGLKCSPGFEYVALDAASASFPVVSEIELIENQDLHGLDIADLTIIVPASGKLMRQAERLADAHRTVDGLSVNVVRADQVYNEFSSGTPDATAYRRLMKMFYDRAIGELRPSWLLLFGDGAWDNRMLTDAWKSEDSDDWLLCYESENSVSQTQSYVFEDYYGLLDDNEGSRVLYEKPDIGVGRFPVVSVAEATAAVDKTVAYMKNENAGAWQNRVMVLGDDGDDNIHMEGAETIASMLAEQYPSLDVDRIYWDSYKMEVSASGNSYPDVRQDILSGLETGALIVNYVGHGSADVLSHELVINKADLAGLDSPRLPLWITASCDITPFDASYDNLGETAFLNPDGGALALFTTARTVYSSMNDRINQLFSKYVLGQDSTGHRYTLGDAVRISKAMLASTDSPLQDFTENKAHYVLMGDPALTLALPGLRAVVDSLSGVGEGNLARAGDVVTAYGHVEDALGTVLTDFTGTVTPTVYDNERLVVCRNNADAADEAFQYSDRDRILYSGNDSVRDGKFSFSFPVPLDINYSYESGRIGIYALENGNARTAAGYYEQFIIGGTSDSLSTDSAGPEIKLYLNTPEFEYGGKVNQTPCLVAEFYDEDGINASGNGVGHDILLVVDNDPQYTYVLNSYYASVSGDYTRGRVVYVMPELSEGRHTLMLRAWDVMNNSSTEYLGFEVVEGLKPDLVQVSASENPARESTSFVVCHDRPGMEVELTVKVYDTMGRQVWNGTASGSSDAGVSILDWNLSTSGGQRVQRGVYIYKVYVSSPDGVKVSADSKLVVL